MKGAGMAEVTNPPVVITNPVVARKNMILRGYAAFNRGDRPVLADLFCDDFEDNGEQFPAWHLMDGTGTIRGKNAILDYLVDDLRIAQGAEAEFLGVASQGNTSITVDYTYNGPEGDHACADKIVF